MFEQKIVNDWLKYFESDLDEFGRSGSKMIARNKYAENLVIIAHVGKRTFIQYHPGVEGKVKELINLSPDGLTLTADHFVSYYENKNIQINNIDELYYLYSPDLNSFIPHDKFTVRKLLVEDEKYLYDLNNSCSEEEVDNSFVDIDELGVWGCFCEDKLVSVAGFSDWGLYGDLGVITHPDYRRQGHAKAVVSSGCKEIIEIGKIPVYRCHITLFQSTNTAIAVGFKKYSSAYSKMEVLKYTN